MSVSSSTMMKLDAAVGALMVGTAVAVGAIAHVVGNGAPMAPLGATVALMVGAAALNRAVADVVTRAKWTLDAASALSLGIALLITGTAGRLFDGTGVVVFILEPFSGRRGSVTMLIILSNVPKIFAC